MATTDYWDWFSRHGEPILLALVVHELAAGAAFTIAGLPGVGSLLWAVGAGLALSYLLVTLALSVRPRWQPQRFVTTSVLLVATAAAAVAVAGMYGLASLLGTLGVAATLSLAHRSRPARPLTVSLGHAARSSHGQAHTRA
jgi:hypothetical protein